MRQRIINLPTLGVVAFVFLAVFSIGSCRSGLSGDAKQHTVPMRIASLVPSVTETLYAMGAGERVVAVSDYCAWPPEARDKPKLGGFANPSMERLLGLRPDLVVLTDGQGELVDKLEKGARLSVLQVKSETMEGVLQSLGSLGERLGLEEQARSLRAQIEGELEAVHRKSAGKDRVTALIVVGHELGSLRDVWTAGAGSFHDEMLSLAGGTNVLDASLAAYPNVSKESIIRAQPEVVIVLANEEPSEEERRRETALWRPLGAIPAVRNGRICVVGGDWVNKPGPRAARVAEAFYACLHERDRGAR